ncbi:MAG: L-serine ammonia-lyase, iron-sulfur-dependent, subunit alpha, partial [Firmicutes bacterium]|nr:L-serine ammonia-lyase, iron-sulfur-dependent, subunit alpha [Bacillota bacterium]
MTITSIAELVETASSHDLTIGALVRKLEAEETGLSISQLDEKMKKRLEVMRDSVARGLQGMHSKSGLTGGDALRMAEALSRGTLINAESLN